MINWQQKIKEATLAPHKFHHLASEYMNATGCKLRRESFDQRLFNAILDGIPNFEQVWRLVSLTYNGFITRPSLFKPYLFRRALALADDTDALKAIIQDYRCPPEIRKRAETEFSASRKEATGIMTELLEEDIF